MLFGQFHDLAAGSGIAVIYKDAQQDYDQVRWATQEISAKASNPAAVAATGSDFSLVAQGTTVLASLSYRIWAPEQAAQPSSIYHK